MRNNSSIGIIETRATRSTMHKRQSDMSGRSLCHSRNRKKVNRVSSHTRNRHREGGSENIFRVLNAIWPNLSAYGYTEIKIRLGYFW